MCIRDRPRGDALGIRLVLGGDALAQPLLHDRRQVSDRDTRPLLYAGEPYPGHRAAHPAIDHDLARVGADEVLRSQVGANGPATADDRDRENHQAGGEPAPPTSPAARTARRCIITTAFTARRARSPGVLGGCLLYTSPSPR